VGFIIAFVSMVIVFGILLPIMGAMYLDILEAKQETKRQQEQVQRLINQAKEKDDSNSRLPPR
jgi:CHASE3 domain sensor protein